MTEKNNLQTIYLPTDFTQRNLGDLKLAIDACYESNEAVQLDASELECVDGSALQFLTAFSLSVKEHVSGTRLLVNENSVLIDAAKDFGLSQEMTAKLFGQADDLPSVQT